MKKNFKSGFIQKCRLRTITFFYGQELLKRGAKKIFLLSLGSEGALFMNNEKGSFRQFTNWNGCEYSLFRGCNVRYLFLAGSASRTFIGKKFKKRSIAAGSSTAFRKGLTDFSDVQELEQQIKIQEEE